MLIHWHVEKKSLAIHSQPISCTASEVAAVVEGAMRHGTTMDVEANRTDSHGRSEIGFGTNSSSRAPTRARTTGQGTATSPPGSVNAR